MTHAPAQIQISTPLCLLICLVLPLIPPNEHAGPLRVAVLRLPAGAPPAPDGQLGEPNSACVRACVRAMRGQARWNRSAGCSAQHNGSITPPPFFWCLSVSTSINNTPLLSSSVNPLSPRTPTTPNIPTQYETFEKDPVKYARYEDAVAAALAETPPGKTSVVMVVGAGRGKSVVCGQDRAPSAQRTHGVSLPPLPDSHPFITHSIHPPGPLVRASLQAATRAERPVRVYAVEKNPNAVVTLRNLGAPAFSRPGMGMGIDSHCLGSFRRLFLRASSPNHLASLCNATVLWWGWLCVLSKKRI